MILSQKFYFQDTTTVARSLLGKILNIRTDHGLQRARIVETEAYLGIKDPACHTFENRLTARTQSMYLDGGHAYIYLIYGMYHCLNFVTLTTAEPEAVLIRAVEPLSSKDKLSEPRLRKRDLKTNGPGKLCRYYGITKDQDGVKLWKKNSPLFVTEDDFSVSEKQIVARPRIGVDYAGEAALWPLRFYIRDNLFISKK